VRIVVEKDGDIIFDLMEDNALAPTEPNECVIVFHALITALEFISGVMPLQSSHATGVVLGARSQAIEQYLEARKRGTVVPLRVPRDILIEDAKS
jgi:hypothetical protein